VFDNILIGVDGRAGGRDAIALATRLAAPDANLTLAHVDAGPAFWWHHNVQEERVFDRSASVLAAERERTGMPTAIVCVKARAPARGLHDLATELAADLIVIGSSRRGLLGRIFLGDDARQSLDGAPCAVAVAPHGYAETLASPVEIGTGCVVTQESGRPFAIARELAGRSGRDLTQTRHTDRPRGRFLRSRTAR